MRDREFFCRNQGCESRIFRERLPEVAARARKAGRLEEAGASEAVRARPTEESSNGPVESLVNELKLVKRQGCGKAKFGLPRARVLAA